MKTTKKISLVILAGLVAGLASFGAYSLGTYLLDDKFFATDRDARLSADPEMAVSKRTEERPRTDKGTDAVQSGMAATKETVPEESELVVHSDQPNVEPVPGSSPELEAEKVTEKRVLVYSAPEGGDSFSDLKGLEEADLVAGAKNRPVARVPETNSEENSAPANAGNSGNPNTSPNPVEVDPDPVVDSDPDPDPDPEAEPKREKIASAGAQVDGGTVKASGEVEVANATDPAQASSPPPAATLRSRVGSNGRVFVGGGWYSNAGAGNINGAAGGFQNPSSPQRIIFDSQAGNGVSLYGTGQVSGLPGGIGTSSPAGTTTGLGGFQPGIQNITNSTQPRSIVPGTSGGGASTPGFTLPVVPTGNLPAAGGGGRINVGGIKLP